MNRKSKSHVEIYCEIVCVLKGKGCRDVFWLGKPLDFVNFCLFLVLIFGETRIFFILEKMFIGCLVWVLYILDTVCDVKLLLFFN